MRLVSSLYVIYVNLTLWLHAFLFKINQILRQIFNYILYFFTFLNSMSMLFTLTKYVSFLKYLFFDVITPTSLNLLDITENPIMMKSGDTVTTWS